jgi:hypothetical protein
MKSCIGFDPGPNGLCAFAKVTFDVNCHKATVSNAYYGPLRGLHPINFHMDPGFIGFAIERVSNYGSIVGDTTFSTCVTAGRIVEKCYGFNSTQSIPEPIYLVPNWVWRLALCGTMKASNKEIRARLTELIGEVGTPKNPGPLLCIRGEDGEHKRDAIGLALGCLMREVSRGQTVEEFRYTP